MRGVLANVIALLLGLVVASAGATPPAGVARVEVERFALLPAGFRQPEGMDIHPTTGEIFVGTFDAREPATQRRNGLLRLSKEGQVSAIRDFGPTPLTGVLVRKGRVYALNFGAGALQRIASAFDADTPVETVVRFPKLSPTAPAERRIDNPDGSQDAIRFGSSGMPAPNGMVFSAAGDLFVSDSFQGAIYRIQDVEHCTQCEVEVLSRDPLLATSGALPFGANGLAFNADQSWLYLTNAGDNRLLRMRLTDGAVEVVAENVPGADGLIFHNGLFWVAANQADQVMAFDESGLLRTVAGRFDGIGPDGAPEGLLFPASTAATSDGWMLVANLSLALSPRAGDEWEERISRWSLARFRIPEELP